MLSSLLLAILALGAAAMPPSFKETEGVSRNGISAPLRIVETRDTNAICTNGVPASKQRHSDYPITAYTLVEPSTNMVSYAIDQEWYDKHLVSGPHYMAVTHSSDPYGAFKCQFVCNAADNCTSFFVSYEDVGTDSEHMNCVLFNSLIDPSVFVPVDNTLGAGGYDKLCS